MAENEIITQQDPQMQTIAYCKIGGKILYRQSDIQAMLERHYNPISKKPWQV